MIPVERSQEPYSLRMIRLIALPELVRIAKTRPPKSDEIKGYREVAADLWRAHLFKCCYCERKLPQAYNDVEHYRPKASADRSPGSNDTHGYWWLAFTWSNLLFACPLCNRSGKNDLFPLDTGSMALLPQKSPPGKEKPLLLNPAEANGVEHIEFVFSVIPLGTPLTTTPPGWSMRKHWWPRARGGSKKGDWTIRVCRLDSSEYVEQYDDHVNKEVRPFADDLLKAIKQSREVAAAFGRASRLLQPSKPYVGLSYDALRQLVPNGKLAPWKLAWPEPNKVGLPPKRQTRR